MAADKIILEGMRFGKEFNEIPVYPLHFQDPRCAELTKHFEEKIKFFLTLNEEDKRKFVSGFHDVLEYMSQ